MPYKNQEDRRANDQARYDHRMAKAIENRGKICVKCGTTENLQFDHVDPATKLFNISTGAAGNASEERFWLEVEKCQLLCASHHTEKSNTEGSKISGKNHHRVSAKLREIDVKYVRGLAELGHTQRAIAYEFGVAQQTVGDILQGRTWTHV